MMDFMEACTDLETDDGKKEVQSPWPPFMKQEIWGSRVRIRKVMKEVRSNVDLLNNPRHF